MNIQKISQELHELSNEYAFRSAEPYDGLIVEGFRLPSGFNRAHTRVLIIIPPEYPDVVPGVASPIYVEKGLRFRGQSLADVHEYITPGWGSWAWMCFQSIDWSARDSLKTLMEVIRANVTNPPTKKGLFEWFFNQ